jgi:hypothetical protein
MTNLEFSEITSQTELRERYGVTQDVLVRLATSEEVIKVNQILADNSQESGYNKLFVGVAFLDNNFDAGKVFVEVAPKNKLMFLNITL